MKVRKISKYSPRPRESQICKQFVKVVKYLQALRQFPKDFEMFHVANESYTTDNYRFHLYHMGVVSGVADYVILLKGGRVACIEFKRDDKSKLRPEQEKFYNRCSDLSIPYLLTSNIDQAVDFIKSL